MQRSKPDTEFRNKLPSQVLNMEFLQEIATGNIKESVVWKKKWREALYLRGMLVTKCHEMAYHNIAVFWNLMPCYLVDNY
jgi:hypothetical protein